MKHSYRELKTDMISKANAKLKSPKAYLSEIREMCMFIGPHYVTDDSLFDVLLKLITELPDQDVERKIVRTAYFLILEILSVDSTVKLQNKIKEDLNRLLHNEITRTGARLCLGWRLLAKVSLVSGTGPELLGTLENKIKVLQYPEKQKRILFGVKSAERDFKNQIENWASLFSALRRTGELLPLSCLDHAFVACSSPHLALARHAMALISALLSKSPNAAGSAFMTKLREGAFKVDDTLYKCHFVQALRSLVTASHTTSKDLQDIRSQMVALMTDSKYEYRYRNNLIFHVVI